MTNEVAPGQYPPTVVLNNQDVSRSPEATPGASHPEVVDVSRHLASAVGDEIYVELPKQD